MKLKLTIIFLLSIPLIFADEKSSSDKGKKKAIPELEKCYRVCLEKKDTLYHCFHNCDRQHLTTSPLDFQSQSDIPGLKKSQSFSPSPGKDNDQEAPLWPHESERSYEQLRLLHPKKRGRHLSTTSSPSSQRQSGRPHDVRSQMPSIYNIPTKISDKKRDDEKKTLEKVQFQKRQQLRNIEVKYEEKLYQLQNPAEKKSKIKYKA